MGIPRPSATKSEHENMRKAKRTLYSLMASSLHRNNELDPETPVHLYQTHASLISSNIGIYPPYNDHACVTIAVLIKNNMDNEGNNERPNVVKLTK